MKKIYLKNVSFKKNFIGIKDINVVKVRFHDVNLDDRLKHSRLTEFIRQERFASEIPVITGTINIEHETAKTHSSEGQHLNVVFLHKGGFMIECLHVEELDWKNDAVDEIITKVIKEYIDDHFGDEDMVDILNTTEQIYIWNGDIYHIEGGSSCYHCGDGPIEYWMR